ncbi:MAG: hypothetical protein ACPG19_10000 [Saprospiraceae bacterium]
MKIRFTLIAILGFALLLSHSATAGTNKKSKKKEGYIINEAGKKINGYVIIKNNITLDQIKIKFIDFKGKKSSYKAKDIKGYGYRAIRDNEVGNRAMLWSHYESRKVEKAPIAFGPKTVFMERVAEGDVVIFEYWMQVNSNIENPYKRYFFLERDGERVKLTDENFVERSASFFSDNQDIANKMGQVNHRFRHMKKVVERYNNWKKRQETASF